MKTNYPIHKVLKKPVLSGRMVFWSINLSKYDIQYILRESIKSQELEDFVAELSSPIEEESPLEWALFMNGASIIKESRARTVLEGPGDIVIKKTLKFKFTAKNKKAEYKSLISGMVLALEMRDTKLKAKSDSQMVTNQVWGIPCQ